MSTVRPWRSMQQPLPLTRREQRRTWTPGQYLARYPRLVAHIICHSLGYATPMKAAIILMHADRGEPDFCEWIDACYGNDARKCVQLAIAGRMYRGAEGRWVKAHCGYMAEYALALKLVRHEIGHPGQILLASWF